MLFYRPEDLARNRSRASAGATDRAVATLATLTAAGGVARTRAASPTRAELSARAVTQAVHLLEDAGLRDPFARRPGAPSTTGAPGSHTDEAVRALAEAEEARARLDATRVEMVRALAEARGCRWRFVLTYLGQTDAADCGTLRPLPGSIRGRRHDRFDATAPAATGRAAASGRACP